LFLVFMTGILFHNSRISETYIIIMSALLLALLVVVFVKILLPLKRLDKTVKLIESADLDFLVNHTPTGKRDISNQILDKISGFLREITNLGSPLEIYYKKAEFAALQNQINPHFLYNTLDSIRGQAIIDGVDEIAEMTEALSSFFRYSISTVNDIVTLGDELKNVESYFKIQQYRFDNRFSLFIDHGDSDRILDYMLPKMTIQPIVENAIYHGLEKKIEDGKVTLRMTATEKRLIIEISDDGAGMEPSALSALNQKLRQGLSLKTLGNTKRRGGIALENVSQRIKLFFGNDYGITVSSILNSGTDVEVTLPLVHEDDVEKLEIYNETRNIKTGTYL
jgi:two-component system, sensor histidine kinase YesM